MTAAQPDRLAILIDQVGRLTEGISELRVGVSELREGISELRSVVQDGFTELKTVSERQEQNISRLVGIVENLLQREEK
ncbi:MAG: hypothetical protein KME35_05230 [Aphanocapsa sp. GSE-SYN-MK-11-07L]|jgi:X-X-X-Leu-X-X-Gly heptad repeat protein|nr:hypothetical protein [Aphanocapsa sp. GSE-SYN-MK-11-07L]